MSSRWSAPASVVEKRSRSFLNTLLEKDEVARARAFCARDEIPEELRAELVALIDAHEQAKKAASDEAAAAQAAAEKAAQDERLAQLEKDKQHYGELRSLLEQREWAKAKNVAAQIASPDLSADATERIAQEKAQHEHAISEQYAGQDHFAVEGGGILLADASCEPLQKKLRATRDCGISPRRFLYSVRGFASLDGAADKILSTPELLGDFIERFSWEGRDRYSWWKPDWSPEERDRTIRGVAESAKPLEFLSCTTGLTRQIGENEDFGGAGYVLADRDLLLRWVFGGGDIPELTAEWEWDEDEVEGWAHFLENVRRYALTLLEIEDYIGRFFTDGGERGPITTFHLVPDENENDAWVYEAWVGEQGVIVLGYFYEL